VRTLRVIRPPAPPRTPEVSVVVPTCRRPQLLERCLHALLQQDLAPSRYEIIVCDDGPDDGTRQLLAALSAIGAARGLAIVYMPITRTQGPAGARNRGWRLARAQIIAFTDDDTIPDPGWLAQGLAALKGRPVAAVSGRVVMPLRSQATDYERKAVRLATAEFVTANCFVRRAVLENVGGFDERFTSAGRGDSDLHFSILRSGGAVERAPGAIVVHPVRPERWGISMKQARKSQFDALLSKKHPEQYRTRIGAPPWRYYLIVLMGAAAIAGFLMGAPGLAFPALITWTVLTLQFAVRRLRGASRRPSHIVEMIVTSIAIPPLAVAWRVLGALKYGTRFP